MPRVSRRLSMPRSILALPLLGALLILSGCVSARQPRSIEDLWKEYEKAVLATKYPAPSGISRTLTPILTFTPGLIWDEGRQKILMATWTQGKYYPEQPGYEKVLSRQVWLTAVPLLQDHCQSWGLQGDALRVRLSQRLGMPPNTIYDTFVEMWVDPKDFFRPCPDPEITDHECQVNLTIGLVDQSSPCPWSAAQEGQVSQKFVEVNKDQLKWMCDNWKSSYPVDKPIRDGYPWTALGYTYDWGSKNVRGESEFVVPATTKVVIRSKTSTDEYCARKPARRR